MNRSIPDPTVVPAGVPVGVNDSLVETDDLLAPEHQLEEIHDLIAKILLVQLHGICEFPSDQPAPWFSLIPASVSSHPYLPQWFQETLQYLARHGHIDLADDLVVLSDARGLADLEQLWLEWQRLEEKMKIEAPQQLASMGLAKACLSDLVEVLAGAKKPTDVLFPEGSLELVESVYQGNKAIDVFNKVLARAVHRYIEDPIWPKSKMFKLLEIGAGTGATTGVVLQHLANHQNSISSYHFTDLSSAFFAAAKRKFGETYPFINTMKFDVCRPVVDQDLALGDFDIVLATNVLHATPNVRTSLRNAKQALRRGGLLLLNEMADKSLFGHITFGLLEGWWNYDDPELRITGSPGIAGTTWRSVLMQEGFVDIRYPADKLAHFGQQIVSAVSDGKVRTTRTRGAEVSAVADQPKETPSDMSADAGKAASPLNVSVDEIEIEGIQSELQPAVQAFLLTIFSEGLDIPQEQLSVDQPLEDYGLDSIVVVQLTNQLEDLVPDIESTLFFEFSTIGDICTYLCATYARELAEGLQLKIEKIDSTGSTTATVADIGNELPDVQTPAAVLNEVDSTANLHAARASGVSVPEQIAIVGFSSRFPGAQNADEFWLKLASGESCIEQIPPNRWGGTVEEKLYAGLLSDPNAVDLDLLNLSREEAQAVDLQALTFLESFYLCIEDAGYSPDDIRGRNIGVYVGVMNSAPNVTPAFFAVANRCSFEFDLTGPSLAVDSACSSSLTAIALAMDAIRAGCEAAVAGGVNLIRDPSHVTSLRSMNLLSTQSTSAPFTANADGYLPAEGVGAVFLKTVDQAKLDGDVIYATILGAALNSSGKTRGFALPGPKGQRSVIGDALDFSGVPGSTISYIEAHGATTVLGDSVELSSLNAAFGPITQDEPEWRCALGSVKSVIGHAEAAAGVSAISKVLLQMQNEQLAPTVRGDELNDMMKLEQSNFELVTSLRSWPRENGTRRAGISAFGAGGSNAHLVVEQFDQTWLPTDETDHIVPISAPSKAQLIKVVERLLGQLIRRLSDIPLKNIAYTLQVGRRRFDEAVVFVVSSVPQLCQQLESFLVKGHADNGNALIKRDVTLQQAHDARLLHTLAQFWLDGDTIDWRALHDSLPIQKVALPGYVTMRTPIHEPSVSEDSSPPSSLSVASKTDNGQQREVLPMLSNEESELLAILGEATGVDCSHVAADENLLTKGFDDDVLMGFMELLGTRFEGINGVADLFDAETIAGLATRINTSAGRSETTNRPVLSTPIRDLDAAPPIPRADTDSSLDVLNKLQCAIAAELGVAPTEVSPTMDVFEMGLTSAGVLNVIENLSRNHGLSLAPENLFDANDLATMASMMDHQPTNMPLQNPPHPAVSAVASSGVSTATPQIKLGETVDLFGAQRADVDWPPYLRQKNRTTGLLSELKKLSLEEHIADLAVQGFTVVPADKFSPPDYIRVLRQAVLTVAEKRSGVKPDEILGATHRGKNHPLGQFMRFVLFEDPVFEAVLTNPVLIGLVSFLIGDDSILSLYDAMVKGPGGEGLPVHNDNYDKRSPVQASMCNVATANLLLSDYEAGCGQLAFLPGSHLFRREPTPAEMKSFVGEMVPIEAPAGSLVVWSADTWHMALPRASEGLRLTALFSFCRPHIQPQGAFRERVREDTLARNGARFRRLMNVDALTPFGREDIDPRKEVYLTESLSLFDCDPMWSKFFNL